VFLSSDQSVSQGASTKIQFDSKVYDSDNNFDTGSHSWSCPQDGIYAVHLQVVFSGGNNGDSRQIFIGDSATINTAEEGASNIKESSDTGDSLGTTSVNRYDSGETIAGHVFQSNSNDTLRSGNDNSRTFLEVGFLGGLWFTLSRKIRQSMAILSKVSGIWDGRFKSRVMGSKDDDSPDSCPNYG